MRRFEDTGVLVTGGASGIGQATAARFASEGARVFLMDINAEALDANAAAISADGGSARALVCDVTDPESLKQAVEGAFAAEPACGVLVNCAGILAVKPFLETEPESINRVLEVNLTGTAMAGQAFARALIAQGGGNGRIVNIASISGLRGNATRTAYGASKGGVINLTKVMAVELARHGIRVNAIAPGPVETPMVLDAHTPEQRAEFNKTVPLGRYGRPEEVAGAIAFLASDDASYITGHVLAVDGGWSTAGFM